MVKIYKPKTTIQEAEELKKSIQTEISSCKMIAATPLPTEGVSSIIAGIQFACLALSVVVLIIQLFSLKNNVPVENIYNFPLYKICTLCVLACIAAILIRCALIVKTMRTEGYKMLERAKMKLEIYKKAVPVEDDNMELTSLYIDGVIDLIKEAEAAERFINADSNAEIELHSVVKNGSLNMLELRRITEQSTELFKFVNKALSQVILVDGKSLYFTDIDSEFDQFRQRWLEALEASNKVS